MSGVLAEMSQKGFVDVTVQRKFYPQIAQHWERQLTGRNAAKWGRIWIDPSSVEKDKRRRENLWEEGPSTRGLPQANRDECPGAMFICETQEYAHVEVCCATQNQAFGRDLFRALQKELGKKMGWWEVRFHFVD